MSFDHYSFVRPGFLRGVAKALDIGGVLSREAFVLSPTIVEADLRALTSDVNVVKEEMTGAFAEVTRDVEQSAA